MEVKEFNNSEKQNKSKRFAKPIMFDDVLLRKTDLYAFIKQINRSEVVALALNELFLKDKEIFNSIKKIDIK